MAVVATSEMEGKDVVDELARLIKALIIDAYIEMEMADETDFKDVLDKLLAALLGGIDGDDRKLLGVDKAIKKEDMDNLTHKLTELLHEKLDEY